MTLDAALQALAEFQRFGLRPGLDTTRTLAARAGNPEATLRFIHVAGTNGKGSTCAMLESIHRAAGRRTGLYTSPHLVRFGERIQVDGIPLPDTDVASLVEEVLPLAEGLAVTFFEFVTVMALRHFARAGCEVVIWETGLGGRWDATNIVTPLASVITNVGLDHQEWLGDTLPKIAAEKAGIIKPGVPVVTGMGLVPGSNVPGTAEAAALRTIRETAEAKGSPLTSVLDAGRELALAGNPPIALLGAHQRDNAAVSLATVRVLASELPVDEAAKARGLTTVQWPGRLQLIRSSGRELLLDGAHNLPGVETLAAALAEYFPQRRPALILGVLADKDWEPICARLAPLASRIIVCPVASTRTLDPNRLAAACARSNAAARIEIATSGADALRRVDAEPFTVATGSLYYVGELLEEIGRTGTRVAGERGLNEWKRVAR